MSIANTPVPPYYAVIFTSKLSDNCIGYDEMAKKMTDLVKNQKGFLGMESARENIGITVSYWDSISSIKNWKNNIEHKQAQKLGKEKWYTTYKTRIVKIEHDYGFNLD